MLKVAVSCVYSGLELQKSCVTALYQTTHELLRKWCSGDYGPSKGCKTKFAKAAKTCSLVLTFPGLNVRGSDYNSGM